MKSLLLILALLVAAPALASPENPTREELRQTVEHIVRLTKTQAAELDAAKTKLETTSTELNSVRKALADSKGQITKLDEQIVNLREWGVDQQNQAIAAQKKLAVVTSAYYKLKWFFCAVCGLLAGILCFILVGKAMLNPVYRIGVAVATGLITSALVFTLV